MKQHQFLPDLPPPANTVGLIGWLRKNLFSTPLNSLLTLVMAYIAVTTIWSIADWGIINANWIWNDSRCM